MVGVGYVELISGYDKIDRLTQPGRSVLSGAVRGYCAGSCVNRAFQDLVAESFQRVGIAVIDDEVGEAIGLAGT